MNIIPFGKVISERECSLPFLENLVHGARYPNFRYGSTRMDVGSITSQSLSARKAFTKLTWAPSQ